MRLPFLILFFAVRCGSFSAAQAQINAAESGVRSPQSKEEPSAAKHFEESKKAEIEALVKLKCKKYGELYEQKKYAEAVDYAIAAHTELMSMGYSDNIPFPLTEAAWDCKKRKDYKTARRCYIEMLKASTGDLWVYPQTCLLYLSAEEKQPKKTKSEINAFLASGKLPEKPLNKRAFYSLLKKLYEKIDDKDGQNEMEKLLKDSHCPVCGSNESIEKYTYGYTGNRGCFWTEWSPMFKCKTDNVEF